MTPNPNPSPELKPCPFCGGEERNLSNAGNECHYTVVCEACDAEGPWIGFDPKIEGAFTAAVTEAHTAWNTRALSHTLPAPGEVGADEFETVEAWEHDDQRELSLLYKHAAHDRPQFNRGQMRTAIRHGKSLATVAAANDEGVAEALDRRVRIAAWNAAKKSGATDALGYAVVDAVVAEFAAIRLLSQGEGK